MNASYWALMRGDHVKGISVTKQRYLLAKDVDRALLNGERVKDIAARLDLSRHQVYRLSTNIGYYRRLYETQVLSEWKDGWAFPRKESDVVLREVTEEFFYQLKCGPRDVWDGDPSPWNWVRE